MRIFYFFLLLLFSLPSFSQLGQINRSKLPQDKSVSEAFDRALQYESMVRDWQPQWKFATPEKTVSEVLKTSLQHLVAAEASAPKNEELFVLTGLVAHFAYNVDVKDSPEIVFTSLARAQELQKQDYRTDWFVGI